MTRAVLLVAFGLVVSGCDANHEASLAVPEDAISVQAALRGEPTGTVVVRGYLMAPYDDVARLCSTDSHDRAQCEEPGLVLERLDPLAYPGLHEGPGTVGVYSTKEVPIRGVVRGSRLYADPAESLRACASGMQVWLASARAREAVERALLRGSDVRSMRFMSQNQQHTDDEAEAKTSTDPTVVFPANWLRPYIVVRPASVSAARRAANAGGVELIACTTESP